MRIVRWEFWDVRFTDEWREKSDIVCQSLYSQSWASYYARLFLLIYVYHLKMNSEVRLNFFFIQ